MRTVEIVPYDPQWPSLFREAAAELCAAFGENLVVHHHIGSTAIPGMPAKPVIDAMPVVQDIERVADAEPALIRIGYEPRGEYGISGRRYFVKEVEGRRSHHVHAFEVNHPAVTRHLAFRDFLIAHPDEARRYAELKLKLADRYRNERQSYVEGKASFIAELERRALGWSAGGA
jgi:GrpB-like predicted nucleotidyltransferase (UPF0157 family)